MLTLVLGTDWTAIRKEILNMISKEVAEEKGGRILMPDGNYLRDRDGQIVITKLNEEMAMNIAKAGNGVYLQVDNTNEAQKILSDQLDKMTKDETVTEMYTGYNELFPYLAALALVLLFVDLVIVTLADVKNHSLIKGLDIA